MSLKDKIKSLRSKITDKSKSAARKLKNRTDSELSAEEVVHEEVFPQKTANKKSSAKRCCASQKPASKRTRPTNGNYKMIDPSNDTCDSGKS